MTNRSVIFTFQSWIDTQFEQRSGWILLLLAMVALLLRLVLIQERWINPDEGAHLMDAQLLLEGQWPVADFGSRQPFYVFFIALFLKVFGISYTAGRLMPVFATLGSGIMLYLIGRRLFGAPSGLLAALMYWFLPLTWIWAVIVKTEPLTVFLCTISVYFFVEFQMLSNQRTLRLFLAGVFAALAFYVRQPALYLPMALVITILFFDSAAWSVRIKRMLVFLSGYLTVCLVFWGLFLNQMSIGQIFFSQLNPLNLIWNRAAHLLGVLPEQYRVVDTAGFRILEQDLRYTLTAWRESVLLTLFILVAAAFFVHSSFGKIAQSSLRSVYTGLLSWCGFVLLLYLFQSAQRGFYTQYFTECLPPLLLLAAGAFGRLFNPVPGRFFQMIATFALFYFLVALHKVFWTVSLPLGGYFVLSGGLVGLLLLIFKNSNKKGLFFWLLAHTMLMGIFTLFLEQVRLGFVFQLAFFMVMTCLITAKFQSKIWQKTTAFASNLASAMLIIITLLITALYSGKILSPRYEAIWSPQTVRQVSEYLKIEGEAGDQVLSGAMIWTFEARLAPLFNVAHPTEFFKKKSQDFILRFREERPRFIIDDGYTQRKFARYWTDLTEEIAKNYRQVAIFEGSRYPVVVYEILPERHHFHFFYSSRLKAMTNAECLPQ